MSIEANIKTLKEALDKSFHNQISIRYDNKEKEKEILEYLEVVLDLEKYSLFNEYSDTKNLYKLALEIKKYNDDSSLYNPFTDYPLCDRLSGFYDDFSEECAVSAEELIDKTQIDLSNLESLKRELASNLITQTLNDYEKRFNLVLCYDYLDKVELINDLEKTQEELPFEIMVQYEKDTIFKDVILLGTIKQSQNFMSVAKNYDGEWICTSHTRRELNNIKNEIKKSKIIYNNGFERSEVAGVCDILESGGEVSKPSHLQIKYTANQDFGTNPNPTIPNSILNEAENQTNFQLNKKRIRK